MRNVPLTPQERAVVEEAFMPFLQAVTIIIKLRGFDPRTVQLTPDRSAFTINDGAPPATAPPPEEVFVERFSDNNNLG